MKSVALLLLISIPAIASPAAVSRSEILGCIGSGGACLKPAKAELYSDSGKAVGWKITHVNGMLARLGIKENDVIVSANGEELTDRSRMTHWVLELFQVHEIDLGILRKGRRKSLKLAVQD